MMDNLKLYLAQYKADLLASDPPRLDQEALERLRARFEEEAKSLARLMERQKEDEPDDSAAPTRDA